MEAAQLWGAFAKIAGAHDGAALGAHVLLALAAWVGAFGLAVILLDAAQAAARCGREQHVRALGAAEIERQVVGFGSAALPLLR